MTAEQVAGLGPAFTDYLRCFRSCFVTGTTFAHLGTYCRGLLSDLPRKSVEPIALAADEVGVVGLIDETSVPKKGDKTPDVQRQYCGARGKVDNCIVTVHLAVKHGPFLAMLDSDLFLPDESWDRDRQRCRAAHIPGDIAYRPKWVIAPEQIERATANGVRFDWLAFDEGYGGKPQFLRLLEERGTHYVAEVPRNFMCWPTPPKYHSLQAPFAAKRADNAAARGKPFLRQDWHTVRLVKSEVGFGHFEGRSWKGLLRHMILCRAVLLFVAEQTTRLRGERSAVDDGADGPGSEHRLPALAGTPPQVAGPRTRRVGHPVPPGPQRGRQTLAASVSSTADIAL